MGSIIILLYYYIFEISYNMRLLSCLHSYKKYVICVYACLTVFSLVVPLRVSSKNFYMKKRAEIDCKLEYKSGLSAKKIM